MVVKVKEPKEEEFGFLRSDLTLFTYLHLAAYPGVAQALLDGGHDRASPTRRSSSTPVRSRCSRR